MKESVSETTPNSKEEPSISSPHRKPSILDRFGGRFLYISIAAHLIFGLVATWFVVQQIEAKRKLTFQAGAKAQSQTARAIEHKIQTTKRKNSMSAPAPAKRITTNAVSARVAIPSMEMAMNMETAPARMAGMGGAGVSFGTTSMGGAPGGGGGGGMPFFGLRQGGVGLEGSFYDFKMRPDQSSNGKNFQRPEYTRLIRSFTHTPWGPKPNFENFKSPAKLYSKFFLFPAIHDSEAGQAFQSPKSAPGGWLAHYKGSFTAPEAAYYRFIGFGDNVMLVKVGNQLVLDASDAGFTGEKREFVGHASFPNKGDTPIFAGEWISLDPGETQNLEIVVGDEGGIFCAGLFIQRRGQELKFAKQGLPELPLFTLGSLTEDEKSKLREYMSEEMLSGPAFRSRPSLFGSH